MAETAHADTFVRDHLPPVAQWPQFLLELPELRYPARLNCAVELLDRHSIARPQALAVRTVEQMTSLREAGLVQYYLGVESGHDAVLARMTKGVDAAEMVRVARKAHDAGVKLSTMILLGAGGEALSTEHARASAAVINAIQPRFVSTLVVTPVEGTPLFDEAMKGTFEDMEPAAITRELREFVAGLDLRGSVFRANHASNWLPIGGTLPKDKAAILAALDEAIAHPDDAPFLPEELRGL